MDGRMRRQYARKALAISLRAVRQHAAHRLDQRAVSNAQARHREVAGEHRPLVAENRDRLGHDAAIRLVIPGLTLEAELRDFDRYVRLTGQDLHRAPPGG